MDDKFVDFPNNGILPKRETQALDFLSKYSNYDGRGVVIAILDTGVDPAASGLQFTSENKRKIIDLYDATGAGNVDISTELTVDSDGFLKGLTGRKLKVPNSWKNPSGKFHCGMKALFDLCSSPLKSRMKKERKERFWQPFNDEALVNTQKNLNNFTNKTKTDSKSDNKDDSLSLSVVSKPPATDNDLIETLTKEDLQAQQELIKDLDGKIKDVGPVYDCLVWNDGEKWRCCIDTSEKGNLDSCKVLTNYRDSHEYGTFSYMDMLNYSLRIMPEEKILQIVTDSGSHGTHVASIASGYNPDKPECNGIAPGAKIISVKIGDNRLGGMETGSALVNACRHIIENNCDLVNYSFGEPANYDNAGAPFFFAKELVEKYGVILCASAGNNGPGIDTCGAPAGYGSTIGVGAYVTTDMIKAEHALLGNGSSMLFTWTSRGPMMDGHLGVNVCAPGGAFADVPTWTQRGTQLMSGTSMASPNCCGCLALILSGLKQNSIEFNPYGVRRAIENTALKIDDILGAGAGLIQVEKAYEYLVDYKESLFQRINFNFKSTAHGKTIRGIYLKHADELYETRDYLVTLDPAFFEDKLDSSSKEKKLNLNDDDLLRSQKDKLALNRKIAIVIDDNDNGKQWIECPTHIYIVNSAKNIYVRVRANELEEGHCYFTQIKGYDMEDPKRTCLFKIPVTVVKPYLFDSKANNDYQKEFNNVPFKQGQIYRHFFRAPHGATHAELTLKCNKSNSDHTPLFFIQGFTLEHFRSQTNSAVEKVYRLNTINEFKTLFKANSNKILQVTVAKNWSNIGYTTADYTIKFYGLYPKNGQGINCMSSQPFPLEIGSYLRPEECEPSIHWRHHIQPLKPTEHIVESVIPSYGLIKPVYQIVLTYEFQQKKSGEVCCEVPLLSHHLYENEYQSIFWMIFEASTKRFIVAGDAFPVIYKYTSSLEKGDYVVKLFIRHESIETLEKQKELSLYVRHTLTCSLNQDIYTSHNSVIKSSGKKAGTERLLKNNDALYYLNTIPDDKLPKGIANGHFLSGDITFFKDSSKNKVDKHNIYYHINNVNTSGSKKTEKSKNKKDEKTATATDSSSTESTSENSDQIVSKNDMASKEEEKLQEALRDTKVAWILKSNQIFESVKSEHENHVPVYLNRIQFLMQKVPSSQNEIEKSNFYEEIIELSKIAIGKIDQNDLLKYIGEKNHDSTSEETKKDYANRKDWIIELLANQGLAMIEKNLLTNDELISASFLTDLKAVYRLIQKWIDITDEKVSKFVIKFYMVQKFYGKTLKVLFKQLEDKPDNLATDKQIMNILTEMKLDHAIKYYENHMIMKYQKKYAIY